MNSWIYRKTIYNIKNILWKWYERIWRYCWRISVYFLNNSSHRKMLPTNTYLFLRIFNTKSSISASGDQYWSERKFVIYRQKHLDTQLFLVAGTTLETDVGVGRLYTGGVSPLNSVSNKCTVWNRHAYFGRIRCMAEFPRWTSAQKYTSPLICVLHKQIILIPFITYNYADYSEYGKKCATLRLHRISGSLVSNPEDLGFNLHRS